MSVKFGHSTPHGPSIIQLIESQLDKAYAALRAAPGDAGLKGRCQGLTEALAVLYNPYAPNEREIKRALQRRVGEK